MVTTPTLRAGAQNTAAPADLEPKSFTALIGLQHLTRRLWPPPELAKPAPATAEPSISPERHQIAKEHNEVLRQIHWARVDYHIAGELDAQRRGDPDTVEHHYEHYICSYHKAKSHEFQRDIHGYHLDSLSNPQNARQNRQKVKELLPMVALHEAQADKRMALC
ncbi:hypothetical protein FRC17_001985 [Serendipita sp. 399]|nr:hypothetical protein FRC17_001985 [Serendipita sp. 399]